MSKYFNNAKYDNVTAYWYRFGAYIYDPYFWAFMLIGGGGGLARWRHNFLKLIDPKPEDFIAELCCGTGGVTVELAKIYNPPKIVACDLSPDQIRVARWKSKRKKLDIDFSVQDASHTSYPSSSFDKIVLSDALHEIRIPTRMAIYEEALRLIKPNGFFFITEPERPQGSWRNFFFELFFLINPEGETTMEIVDGGLERELIDAGFKIEKKELSHFGGIQYLKCSRK